MARYLGNALSLQMLDLDNKGSLIWEPVTPEDIAKAGPVSIVGHDETAAVLTEMLGIPVEKNRVSVELLPGDVLYAAQIFGKRLPEGCTSLPPDSKFKFVKVTLG